MTAPNSGSAIAPAEGPIPRVVSFPNAHRARMHEDFLDAWRPIRGTSRPVSTVITPDERWEVVGQWDAFPDLPSAGEVRERMERRARTIRRGAVVGAALFGVPNAFGIQSSGASVGEVIGFSLFAVVFGALVGLFGTCKVLDWWLKGTVAGLRPS